MKRLYITAVICIFMLPVIPFAPVLAVSASAPLYTHFTYMFAHASILHWLVNSWAFLMLHNTFRWYRCITAYACAVIASFIPATVPAGSPAGLLGASALTCFFIGFITPHFYLTRNRFNLALIAVTFILGFILPGIAALLHVIIFALGILMWFAESIAYSFLHFTRS